MRPTLGPAGRFYAGFLWKLERLLVVLLALLITLGGLILAAGRTLNLQVVDAGTLQTVVFIGAFYLCLFGAILATRRSAHIGIDAIAPHLPAGPRLRLEGVLMLVSAATSILIAIAAWRYVGTFIPESARIVPGTESGLWSTRLWRWPVGLCFAWMGLHFTVGGLLRIQGKTPAEMGLEEALKPASEPPA